MVTFLKSQFHCILRVDCTSSSPSPHPLTTQIGEARSGLWAFSLKKLCGGEQEEEEEEEEEEEKALMHSRRFPGCLSGLFCAIAGGEEGEKQEGSEVASGTNSISKKKRRGRRRRRKKIKIFSPPHLPSSSETNPKKKKKKEELESEREKDRASQKKGDFFLCMLGEKNPSFFLSLSVSCGDL